ncbi:glycosyltransferase [Aciditerrimonas ferrireducens]|uniref:UDP-N-acetylglucosamine--N-acetylmuramyl-(pentapeptide) pyrophosphoryl-undecaprenol N-acetylglucosamine transferase n=1 Tax=Aciditerrimonas ferrireducens TaxID=667306 RepID=A0ABV6C8D4_9ACTN|nr:UDP-N-acetylglucosamine--N-acetylmuramyl-(pentapeptide) pyrophosphoryl-undecaprenol N-acetylglucosamine transferase [Aciditerrimonas ferrireducens]MCK4178205.1 UDP-N-acetylglucosamine--N-acetylmuramyl-(pentapeptide) pyrophosphoryl-undecaprenol N-acetylglucosamine transferase [Aciditerrimonas ferrireducens]
MRTRRAGAQRFALLAGGGTGGHLAPAIALAEALEEQHGAGSVELVVSRRGLAATEGMAGALPVSSLPGRGVRRAFSPGALVDNLGALGQLALAGVQALGLVARRRPAVVVGVGGYASVPVALAGRLLGVPLVVVDVDAVPGLANRFLARFAAATAAAWPDSGLPRAVLTGPPIRREVAAVGGRGPAGPSAAARERLGLPPARRTVCVVGGSLGARRLNEAALGLATAWASRSDLTLYHVVGRRDWPWVAEAAPSLPPDGLSYKAVPFEEHMADLYQAADLVVARAGAMTVAELAVVGVPAVLVPLPGAPGDHQRHNAELLSRAGAAEVVADDEASAARLAEVVSALLDQPEKRLAMARAARALGRPDGTLAVLALVEAHARPRGSAAGRRS